MEDRSLISSAIFCTLVLMVLLATAAPAKAQGVDENQRAAQACMRSWGNGHPFTDTPPMRLVSGAVRVLGRGTSVSDRDVSDFPVLVVVEPGVNVLGEGEMELLNPNGWYCLRAAVTVGGGLRIKLHCDAQLASASLGPAVFGDNANQGVSVMGDIRVERVACQRR